MLLNATIGVFVPLIAKNSEGTTTKFWGYKGMWGGVWTDTLLWDDAALWGDGAVETLNADVQARTLTQAEIELWGLSKQSSDVKAMYFDASTYAVVNNRVSVLSDFDAALKYYEIKAMNPWPLHREAVLVPVQGE